MNRSTKMPRMSGPIASPSRARRQRASRRFASLLVEALETRQLLTGVITTSTPIPAPYFVPTDSNPFDAQNGPMANLGTELVSIYKDYAVDFAAVANTGNTSAAAAGALATQIATQFPTVELSNAMVNMDINSLGGDFNQFVSQLSSLGMQVTDTSSAYGIVEGWVPIAELPTIARLPQTEAGHAIAAPVDHACVHGLSRGWPTTSRRRRWGPTPCVRRPGWTGTGVTVGVLSERRQFGQRRTRRGVLRLRAT